MGAGTQPCDDASDWSVALMSALTTPLIGTACTASILDGTQVGPFTLGWQVSGQTAPQVVSPSCPPTLLVSAVNAAPSALPAEQTFSVSVGDFLYDVTLHVSVGCPGATGDAARKLSCGAL
jgi:hypothetical protein